jgi:hypothetical protein
MDQTTSIKEVPDTTILPEYNSFANESKNPWTLLLIIAVSILAVSVSFNIYLLRQNDSILTQRAQQNEVSMQFERYKKEVQIMVQDVAQFSLQHPEVRDILGKYGVTITQAPPPASNETTPPPVPSPFPKK